MTDKISKPRLKIIEAYRRAYQSANKKSAPEITVDGMFYVLEGKKYWRSNIQQMTGELERRAARHETGDEG